MSCFVVIPSTGDTDAGRFKRLGPWDIETEIIQIRRDGAAARIKPADCDYTGLLVVGRAFLHSDAATALLLSGKYVKPAIDGIFLHPGITNAPGKNEVMNVLGRLHKGLGVLAEKVVAFTHSGFAKYQVRCLHELWEWLASPALEGEGNKVPGFDIESLKHDFGRLLRLSGRSQLVELFLLAEGCVDGQLKDTASSEFKTKLLLELKDKASWLQRDDNFKEPVLSIMEEGGGANFEAAVRSFSSAIRGFFEAQATK